ncbi:MAG: hypothetical protein AAGA18_12880, partial [Verrucomicrobiota bacterium]
MICGLIFTSSTRGQLIDHTLNHPGVSKLTEDSSGFLNNLGSINKNNWRRLTFERGSNGHITVGSAVIGGSLSGYVHRVGFYAVLGDGSANGAGGPLLMDNLQITSKRPN